MYSSVTSLGCNTTTTRRYSSRTLAWVECTICSLCCLLCIPHSSSFFCCWKKWNCARCGRWRRGVRIPTSLFHAVTFSIMKISLCQLNLVAQLYRKKKWSDSEAKLMCILHHNISFWLFAFCFTQYLFRVRSLIWSFDEIKNGSVFVSSLLLYAA